MAAASYLKRANSKSTIPQNRPYDEEQVKNNAGGYVYNVDNWTQLRRFLVLGTENGSYYANERDLTLENCKSALSCIKEDGEKVVSIVTEMYKNNTCPKPDTLLYTLAMCMANGDEKTRKAAYSAIKDINTGYQLLTLADFADSVKGWGSGMRRGFGEWYTSQTVRDLSYQVAKYQNRNGWTMRDLLRLSHPKSPSEGVNAVFNWVTQGVVPSSNEENGYPFTTIIGMEELKNFFAENPKNLNGAINIIRKYNLPRECIPTELLGTKEVQLVLLENMPFTALIRNLGNLTRLGAISNDNVFEIASKIEEGSLKARVHPIAILSAMRTYGSGHGLRGTNSWTPLSRIVDALDTAFYNSFNNIEKTNRKVLVSIDVSGSMGWGSVAGVSNLSVREGASAMAMAISSSAPNSIFTLFDTAIRDADISKKHRLDTVMNYIFSRAGGGTDTSLPFTYALRNNLNVDAIVILTDSETWAGGRHGVDVISEYRKKINPQMRAINVAMVSNSFSGLRQNDPLSLEVVGFDTTVPDVISAFIEGKI